MKKSPIGYEIFMLNYEIITGDCLEVLKGFPDRCVQCCVTSPPYFGLRDYDNAAQIGQEGSMVDYIRRIVDVFSQVHRVLRDDGTLWLNLGDSYNAAGRKGQGAREGYKQGINRASALGKDTMRPSDRNLKPKDLMGIPWRVALALQDFGWYLRQDIIWHKPNPMPESVKDRCVKSHEYLFLLAKNERYYFNHLALQEPSIKGASGSRFDVGKTGIHQGGRSSRANREDEGKRNKRDVWSIPTYGYKEAHFATFPPRLVEPCILAGAPEGSVVLDPFAGSGTTGMVARQKGRAFVGIELNPEYAELARSRIMGDK